VIARILRWISLASAIIAITMPTISSAEKGVGVTEIPDPKMVLNQVKLISQGPGESIFQVNFYPRLPPYQILADNNERETGSTNLQVRFENSRRGLSSSKSIFSGLVKSIEFNLSEPDLSISFKVDDASKMAVQQLGPEKLLVTVKRVPKRASSSFDDFAGLDGTRPTKNASGQSSLDQNSPGLSAVGQGDAPYPPAPAYSPPNGIAYPDKENGAYEDQGAELIKLKYADVSEVVGLLTEGITVRPNNIFIRREPGFGSPGKGGGGGGGDRKPEDNEQPLGESVDRSLAIDRRLNAIWVKGTAAHIARVKRQIEIIDVPVDSVILETQFIELSENGARNLGIDLANSVNQSGVATARYGEFVPLGLDPGNILKSFSLQAALYAQIQKGEGRILSKPRISAQSGSTAKIITGDALPILTSITLSGVNGVSQQVEYVNVGVTLQIAPRVSPDGYVTSQIYAVVSSVTGYSQGYPTISQREAETSASVRDGDSFVLGGLIQENAIQSKSKVPFLGDIPLLGRAFSYEKTSRGKTELYIIITPRIVRHHQSGTHPPDQDRNISPVQEDLNKAYEAINFKE
jgi:general secretion pathway protein D